jgi:hypothetical protein
LAFIAPTRRYYRPDGGWQRRRGAILGTHQYAEQFAARGLAPTGRRGLLNFVAIDIVVSHAQHFIEVLSGVHDHTEDHQRSSDAIGGTTLAFRTALRRCLFWSSSQAT